ncbi:MULTISPECIES: Flp family type IVb pilin [Vibrio]|jgi:Flp pilus assembly pilin Flp|uniref:Flp family type IVb pilin n=1 Tax=Vibrio diazotrophicus TaxID=685 RepID=A0A2J8HUS1_VIBDI|nr:MULTISPECIES: Flp family type IVb pilin [Vibrio]MCF7362991.1 hypothetical protein [Vibrio sp. A1-b2]PNI02000.1 Flp family type IVb pilin [Vibrio diazotrophicus]PNI04863.1 Flp family type IVb pilin [Vibrio diazotrophicus]RAS66597.1 Flp pilus assembly pilin Flp [Vibrio diazotrophicus]
MKKILSLWQSESGLSAVEYIVAGSLLIAVLVAGFAVLGPVIDNRFLFLRNALNWE